ncbi:MAG: DUF2264 domain-containing protein [Caldilineaceae bacterium]|nr:DUF2264 domain-containing protein [Caldilineaceae bacterium]HRJ44992.1 DUF2264 domain-containing protein [Caldilineaceae bacterium]
MPNLSPVQPDRAYWLTVLERIARPVLEAGAVGELRARMPLEHRPESSSRHHFAHLEVVGRLLCGIAPWLELEGLTGEEETLRRELTELAQHTLAFGVDPASPDFFNFSYEHQPIVDAAFLAEAFVRAPQALWQALSETTKAQAVDGFRATRSRKPGFNNWLLFAAQIEAFLYSAGVADWDPMRVDYALRQHEQWYLGDGIYGDGPEFHWDYYNSFVIQPMLIDTLALVQEVYPEWGRMLPAVRQRATRYAAIQERLISPEATYPPIGRSLVYRFGAFQSLAQASLLHALPAEVTPSQVRAALTGVIRRQMEAPGTFNDKGWLTLGFCGHQPGIGETYISTGSIYLCAVGLLPLGLPPSDPFWADPPQPWTSQKAWGGVDMPCDHALRGR